MADQKLIKMLSYSLPETFKPLPHNFFFGLGKGRLSCLSENKTTHKIKSISQQQSSVHLDSTPQIVVSNEHDLPVVLLHRSTKFTTNTTTSFTCTLKHAVHWLDPVVDSPQLVSALRASVQLMVCVQSTPVDSHVLERYPALECIICRSTGVDHVDPVSCHRRGIKVTNVGDAFSDDVADYAVGLLIDVMRECLPEIDLFGQVFGVSCSLIGTKVSGKRVGIVGLGNIGLRVAKRLQGFDCTISYNSKRKKPNVCYLYYENVRDLAANSDVLIIACALTKGTHYIVSKDVLRALGREGIIVNVGRGGLIDEKEMVKLLSCGELGGAGLDVFEEEPRVPNELFSMDNVVLSPHRGASSSDKFDRTDKIVVGNLKSFFSNNQPLLSEVHGATMIMPSND